MKIETRYNVGDRVYFIKDGQIHYAPISEIKIRAYLTSPNHWQTPNTLNTENMYVFIKWMKTDKHTNYTEATDRFELEEEYCHANTEELLANSHIMNTNFNIRGEV